MKALIGRLVLPVICVLLGWGAYALGGLGQGGEVRCGDRTMSAGDSCDHITNGATRTNTYDQEKAEDDRVSNLVQNAGLGIIGLSGVAIVWVLVSSGVRASRKKPDEPLPA